MIELIPAIDIIEGQCVRLTKGDYDQKTVYGSPLEMAQEFERIGFRRLHIVDLDGAKSKHIVNGEVLDQISTKTNLLSRFFFLTLQPKSENINNNCIYFNQKRV